MADASDRRPGAALALAAAGLSAGAGLIHASVIVAHFREYWLFGVLFAIIAPAQLAWAELVRRHSDHRRLLAAGAAANTAIAAVWVASRTTGLPIGPDAGTAEPIGAKDALATANELVIALIVALILSRTAARRLAPLAWALAAASVIGALLPGGHT